MFKYTSTTIINSDKDFRSDKAMFSSIAAQGQHGAILRIKRDYTFEMPGIKKVYKKEASEPVKAELTINCENLLGTISTDAIYPLSGRLAIYMTLEGSEESVFANDWYQKGMPLSIGFLITGSDMTGSELATQLKNTINKFNLGVVGRKLYEASVSGSELTLKCTGEYQRFKGIAALIDLGIKEVELVHYFDGELDNTQDTFTLVERGAAGFGTFHQLSKDLRLPTAMNTSWTALQKTDKPVPGALYNQYIIYYSAPSGTNPSLVGVGHETVTNTTHIFWVKQEYAEAFETVITEVVGSGPVKDDPTAIFEEV